MKAPQFVLAQVGASSLQSAHKLFSGRLSNSRKRDFVSILKLFFILWEKDTQPL